MDIIKIPTGGSGSGGVQQINAPEVAAQFGVPLPQSTPLPIDPNAVRAAILNIAGSMTPPGFPPPQVRVLEVPQSSAGPRELRIGLWFFTNHGSDETAYQKDLKSLPPVETGLSFSFFIAQSLLANAAPYFVAGLPTGVSLSSIGITLQPPNAMTVLASGFGPPSAFGIPHAPGMDQVQFVATIIDNFSLADPSSIAEPAVTQQWIATTPVESQLVKSSATGSYLSITVDRDFPMPDPGVAISSLTMGGLALGDAEVVLGYTGLDVAVDGITASGLYALVEKRSPTLAIVGPTSVPVPKVLRTPRAPAVYGIHARDIWPPAFVTWTVDGHTQPAAFIGTTSVYTGEYRALFNANGTIEKPVPHDLKADVLELMTGRHYHAEIKVSSFGIDL
jgi:hypothetical protein